MTTTPETTNLAQFLDDAPGRGLSVRRIDGQTYDLIDCYGNGSTDLRVTVRNVDGVECFYVTPHYPGKGN